MSFILPALVGFDCKEEEEAEGGGSGGPPFGGAGVSLAAGVGLLSACESVVATF